MFFFFQAEDGIRDYKVTGVQTCALPICGRRVLRGRRRGREGHRSRAPRRGRTGDPRRPGPLTPHSVPGSGPLGPDPGTECGVGSVASPGVDPHPVSAQDLLRWSEALSAIARTGLGFSDNLYERERFEEVLKVAADIRVAAGHELESEVLVEEWLKAVGSGVPGYVTPKVAVGAVGGNAKDELLLVPRADSGVWR